MVIYVPPQPPIECERPNMELTEDVIRSYKVACVIQDFADKVNSLSFSDDGDFLIASSDDDQMVLVDALKGVSAMTIPSKRYGCEHVTFTHSVHGVLHASRRGGDDSIRYLDVREMKYERCFSGHTKKITGLMMGPMDDRFISVSEDKSLRLWDLRQQGATGILEAPCRPVAAFDPDGLIFAAGFNNTVKLYDLRNYDKGPFLTASMPRESSCDWTGMKISNDGSYILVSTNASIIRVLDAFEGAPKATLSGQLNNKGIPLEASFSPDSKYIFSGSTDGKVHCWNTSTGVKVPFLSHEHPGPVQCIKVSPRYHCFATACSMLSLWVTHLEDF